RERRRPFDRGDTFGGDRLGARDEVGRGHDALRRWRAASNSKTVPAIATFSDSPACMGIVTRASSGASGDNPCVSLPSTSAWRAGERPPRGPPPPPAPPPTRCQSSNPSRVATIGTPSTIGTAKHAPADARTTLGLYASTDPRPKTTPPAPAATALRSN